MNTKFFFDKFKHHLIAIAVFFIGVFIFCKPAFENKVVLTTDGVQFQAMNNNIAKLDETKNGDIVLWNRNLFSGMPFNFESSKLSHFISTHIVHPIVFVFFPKMIGFETINWTAAYFFVACISFYLLCYALKINHYVGIVSSLAFAFSLQTSILVIAGHHTKLVSLALMPMVVAGLFFIFQKKYWVGAIISILSLCNSMLWAHYQMVFYTFIVMGFITIGYIIYVIKTTREFKHLLWSGVFIIGIFFVCIGTFIPKLLSYEEYSKETIRGGSKIVNSANSQKKANGLDKSYAFSWSYGIGETLTFISPDIYGGASGGRLNEESAFFQKLTELGINEEQALGITNQIDTYWAINLLHWVQFILGLLFAF